MMLCPVSFATGLLIAKVVRTGVAIPNIVKATQEVLDFYYCEDKEEYIVKQHRKLQDSGYVQMLFNQSFFE